MELSRRMFKKEFKLAVVQRLERGSSIGEVARGVGSEPQRAAPLAASTTIARCEEIIDAGQKMN